MRLVAYGLLCAGVLLSGCASGGLFGGKSLPDESRVIAGPKLAVPPDFELRPPRGSDEDFATKVSAEESGKIETLISGGKVEKETTTQATDTDSWLLEAVGGQQKVAPAAVITTATTAIPMPQVDAEPAAE